MKKIISKYLSHLLIIIAMLFTYMNSGKNLLGDIQTSDFYTFMFFGLVGYWVILNVNANERDPMSQRSPFEFSYGFLVFDNLSKFVRAILFLLLALRFLPELFGGKSLNPYNALLAGTFLDALPLLFKKARNTFFSLIGHK